MKKKSNKRKRRGDYLVPKLILIVFAVVFLFEGQLIYTMFTFQPGGIVIVDSDSSEDSQDVTVIETESIDSSTVITSLNGFLAGISDAALPIRQTEASEPTTEAITEEVREPKATVSNPDSAAIVPVQEEAVDDSYFADAAFIGDSRMQGFRNTSGISSGTFFTSVGMTLSSMTSSAIIADSGSGESITVAAALSGGTYNKLYIMLGANDLGAYDWSSFKDGLISVTQRFLEIQPDATLYLCSCIYVEEEKVTTGDYINNDNVDTLNAVLLEVCEENSYYYLDFNEVLGDGYGSLIEGASSDGVHLNSEYCVLMYNYLQTHYIIEETDSASDDE